MTATDNAAGKVTAAPKATGNVTAVVERIALGADRPLVRSDDPFFDPPAGFAADAPGTVLRHREVETAFLGVIPQRVSAWQLLYRSTDLHGEPDIAMTTVLLPDAAGALPDGRRPVLAFQSAIDAVDEKCAPSYALRRGGWVPGSITQVEWLLIAQALRRGWVVSVADHEGAGGHFLAPRGSGYVALDGVRAALGFKPLGLEANAPIATWGYSGGGLAASWVAELAPAYAPELDLVGAVLGAPIGDPVEVFLRLNGGPFAGLPTIALAGLRHIYPAFARVVDTEMTPAGRQIIDYASRLTPFQAVRRLRDHDFGDNLRRPVREVLTDPGIRAVFDDLRPGATAPDCPVLVIQPQRDQVIATTAVDGQVDRYRRAGAEVTYLCDRASEHLSLLPLSVPLTLDWLADRVAGKPVEDTGTHSTAVVLDPRNWLGYVELATTAIRIVIGRPLRRPMTAAPARRLRLVA
ncbi:lipase family protein [Nocardia stercoris]|uniref:Lipase n=1 Tax=Nocardia stercoris TaxID=2483361 RepID=A0A3M2L966_9NOCA|nr:lipase family protein [Nocardia stercoris]RMI33964.1 lipase [Nocardia stercoris]